jgi:hypothetical protein
MNMNEPVDLVTGDKEVMFPGDWDKVQRVRIEQLQPLPLHIEAIIMELSIN